MNWRKLYKNDKAFSLIQSDGLWSQKNGLGIKCRIPGSIDWGPKRVGKGGAQE